MNLTRRAFFATTCMGALSLAACDAGAGTAKEGVYNVEMVTNTGGIHDQGFCELSWKGLQRLRDTLGYKVSYIESKQDSDYFTNLDKAIDYGANFVWSIGFAMADAAYLTARINHDLDVRFGIVDSGTNGESNLTGILFATQEPSFLVGYVAGKTTKSNKVGFVGGIESDNIYSFEYGYMGGVLYAAKELGHEIEVFRQYAESFNDSAKGKSIAQKMFAGGTDIIYHAAGSTGIGVIEAAQETGKFAIGVDMDQSYLAPNNVLTSALKRVDHAIEDLTPQLLTGEIKGGTDIILKLEDGDYMGIPEEHGLMPEGVYEDTLALMEMIKVGTIVPPATSEEYEAFKSELAK